MTEEDFLTIDYLINGSAEQQNAYYALLKSGLFVTLKDFNPVLVGTMPLDLFVNGSDLDICCEVYNLEEFSVALDTNFEKYIEYSVRFKILNSIESVICTFRLNDFIFEIVGQPVKVTNQLAFRQLSI